MTEQTTQSPAKPSLRDLINKAQHQLCTYRRPNVDEVSKRLGEVLQILGRGSLEYDDITSIEEEGNSLVINTAYSLRGCSMSGEYEIALSIVDAEDPCAAARRWLKQQALDEAEEELARMTAELQDLPDYALRLKARIDALQAQTAAQRKELA